MLPDISFLHLLVEISDRLHTCQTLSGVRIRTRVSIPAKFLFCSVADCLGLPTGTFLPAILRPNCDEVSLDALLMLPLWYGHKLQVAIKMQN